MSLSKRTKQFLEDSITDSTAAAELAAAVDAASAADVVEASVAYVDAGLLLKENAANKDTDNTLAANSDVKFPSQKAIKAYVAAQLPAASGQDISATFDNGVGGVTLRVQKVGRIVSIHFPAASTANVGSNHLLNAASGTIPSAYCPIADIFLQAFIHDNNTDDKDGKVKIGSGGNITFYKNDKGDNFSNNGLAGWISQDKSWVSAS